MFKDIEFSPQDRYMLLFRKSFWSPEEMATIQSLELGFHEQSLTASADLRTTSRRAIFEFLSYSFKNFMGNAQFQLHREQLFNELRVRFWELACAFENEFLTKLNYPKPLFEHQKESAQFISERQHALAALEQGLGKTITAATVSRIHNIARTIVVCPAVVKWNWFRDLTDDWGYNPMYFTILDATKRRTVKAFIERFVIINFDIVKDNLEYLLSKPTGHIILDECFPYDTIVDTNWGFLPIGMIVEKKLECKVLSYRQESHTFEYKKIVRHLKNDLAEKSLVKINYGNESIICTASHKIWTPNGYRKAIDLHKGDQICRKSMRMVRKELSVSISRESYREEALLWERVCRPIQNEFAIQEGEAENNRGAFWQAKEGKGFYKNLTKDEAKQSDAEGIGTEQGVSKAEGSNILGEGRERQDNEAAGGASQSDRTYDGILSHHYFSEEFIPLPSESLYGRFGFTETQTGSGSGRENSQAEEVEVFGQTQDRGFELVRVDSVEILERGSGSEYERLCPEDKVYDLEVEGNHNYFADGILVSNCHIVKNHNTAKFKAVQKLLWAFPEARVTYLSGTPVKNRVNDLFAYLKLSNHFLGQNHSAFLKEYTHQKKGGLGKGQVTGGKNLDDLYLKISNFMIRKVKEECLDLPDKLINKYYFQLDEWQAEYDKALAHLAAFKDVSNIHSALHTLNIIVAKSKIPGIIELIDSIVDAGRKPLVFCSYSEPLETLEKHYKDSCVKITGSVDSYMRDQLVQKFKNDENVTVFLGNMIAAGVGINLTNSSDVIFMNFPFTPADLHQAIDRTHRIGQKNIVNVYYTICEESIDEHLFALISDKAADINALIDKGKPTIEYESIPNQLFKKLLEKYKNGEEPSEQVSAESTNGGIQRSLPESYFGE